MPRPLVISYIIVKSNYFRRTCQIVRSFLSAAFLLCASLSGAQTAGSAFAEGEALFLANKPAEAAPRLEASLREDSANLSAYLYLGIAYHQLGRYDQAIETFKAALPRSGPRTALVCYNIGNAYFAKGSAAFADEFYTRAIQADPAYSSAFLNRANARIKTGALAAAASDYGQFLTLEPASPKRPEIERVLALIGREFEAAEAAKLQAIEAAKADEERRKRLLEEVAASLQAAAEDTKGLSSGSEDVIQYEGEFELE